MTNDYYNDGADSMPASKEPMDDQGGDGEEKDPRDEATALIPSSLCPDMSPGDEVTLKIVAVHDGEYEVTYIPKEEKAEKEQPSMDRASETKRSPMASMMD